MSSIRLCELILGVCTLSIIANDVVAQSGSYKGCFRDSSARLLPNFFKNLPNNSPDRCMTLCRISAFLYAGVEDGGQCWCGNTLPSEDYRLAESDCDKKCPKYPTKKCGGSWKINVYETGVSDPVPYPYHGCFRDSSSKRVLPHYQKGLSDNSPERCVASCRQSGYLHAGVEDGGQCYCGNELPSNDYKLAESDCNKKCPGDPTEKCGGSLAINIYKTGASSPRPYHYRGCFRDSGNRLLPDYKEDLPNNSPEQCVTMCRRNAYAYAGVEDGGQCWCGTTSPSEEYKLGENECNKKCPKNPTEKCGGSWSINVYVSFF